MRRCHGSDSLVRRAEWGLGVRPLTTVTGLREVAGGWRVETGRTGAWLSGRTRGTVTAEHVVLAAQTTTS